jgi:hypothetical protein
MKWIATTSLPLLLSVVPALAETTTTLQWSTLALVETDAAQNAQETRRLVRGEKKTKSEETKEKSGKKVSSKMHECSRDRTAVTVSTMFDAALVTPVNGESVVGVEFAFEGDYTGTWTQTSIEVSADIVLGHDQLTFYDELGEVVGALTTQFDGNVDFAIVTAGFGMFACAQGSPTINYPDETSDMVNVVWNLCVCYD